MIWLSQRNTLRYHITFSLEYDIHHILPLLITQKRPFLRVIFGQNIHIIYGYSVHFIQYKLLQSLYFIKYPGIKLFFVNQKINLYLRAIYLQYIATNTLKLDRWSMVGSEIGFLYFLGADAGTLYFRSALGSEKKNIRMRRRKMDP
jgi:hypothetical protein